MSSLLKNILGIVTDPGQDREAEFSPAKEEGTARSRTAPFAVALHVSPSASACLDLPCRDFSKLAGACLQGTDGALGYIGNRIHRQVVGNGRVVRAYPLPLYCLL
jgi:hypothetical protein